jgi:putative copper resistance protein D
VNFLRALSAGHAARELGPVVEPERAWLVAPDFTFATGPAPAHTLREYRGRRIVLLVLYSLPGSHERLQRLARAYMLLATLGVEVIAVPVDGGADALRHLRTDPPAIFPVVTESAADIAGAYRLFAPGPHAELLVDRQGYVRARWGGEAAAADVNTTLAEVQQLNAEKVAPAPPDEHVH